MKRLVETALEWATSETYLLLVTAATIGLLPLMIFGRPA